MPLHVTKSEISVPKSEQERLLKLKIDRLENLRDRLDRQILNMIDERISELWEIQGFKGL